MGNPLNITVLVQFNTMKNWLQFTLAFLIKKKNFLILRRRQVNIGFTALPITVIHPGFWFMFPLTTVHLHGPWGRQACLQRRWSYYWESQLDRGVLSLSSEPQNALTTARRWLLSYMAISTKPHSWAEPENAGCLPSVVNYKRAPRSTRLLVGAGNQDPASDLVYIAGNWLHQPGRALRRAGLSSG